MSVDWKILDFTINEFSSYDAAWVEPGSGIDFLAISARICFGGSLTKYKIFGRRVLLESHSFGATYELLTTAKKTKFDGFVTPLNNLGVMMFSTKNHVETALTEAKKHGKLIVAIKPFAGGRIKFEEALDYVFRKAKVDACMVEVGSEAEAEIDFRSAEKVLSSLPCSSR